jgi:hypothetical protein
MAEFNNHYEFLGTVFDAYQYLMIVGNLKISSSNNTAVLTTSYKHIRS